MPASARILALAAAASTANAAFQGFNYGATLTTGQVKVESDYEAEFKAAANLAGTNGAFSSARIYTMIQGGTPNQPIAAVPAAIKTKTSLLFGLWASAGAEQFNNEIAALKNTIDQYCDQLDGLVAGISVGSEDLYRNSPTGIENGEYAGADPDTLVGYIDQVRETIQGTCLGDAPIGHVDTWTAFANSSNQALIDACDWLGMDAYAYFENTKPNGIENGQSLFEAALDATVAAAGGKDVWITETGWPVSGDDFGDAIPSPENAEAFWNEVGCPRFGKVNVWWYTLLDAAPDTPNPSFGVISSLTSEEPLYDLSCDGAGGSTPSSSSSSAAPPPASSSVASSSASSVPEPEPTTTTSEVETSPSAPVPSPTTSNDTSSSVVVPTLSTSLPSNTTVTSAPPPGETSAPPAETSAPPPGETTTITTAVGGGESPTTEPGTEPTTTEVPAGSSKLNSLGAAGVAIFVAAALL
jgi:glucan endo-1,3-beta-D-glucosidase